MKLLNKVLGTLATAGFIMAQPIAAQAATHQTMDRVAAQTQGEKLAGPGGHAIVIIGIALALLLLAEVTGLIDVFGNDNELPHSP